MKIPSVIKNIIEGHQSALHRLVLLVQPGFLMTLARVKKGDKLIGNTECHGLLPLLSSLKALYLENFCEYLTSCEQQELQTSFPSSILLLAGYIRVCNNASIKL